MSFKEFLKELKKKKFELEVSEKALALQSEIKQTEKEIDQMVYELYGLTKDEIAVVEAD